MKVAALAGGALLVKSALSHLFEYDLKNKTVLITGGSRGLGLVMAREFAREGARLALCARDDEELERARIDLDSFGTEVMVFRCDVRNRQEVADMIAAVTNRFGHLFPEAMSQVLATVNQFLPKAGGAGTERVKGRDSTSSWSPSWLTTLNEEAAVRNNEVVH